MNKNQVKWHRRERRVSSPFADCSAVLDPVAFSPAMEIEPQSSRSAFLVDSANEPRPYLSLALDSERLAELDPETATGLQLAVILRFSVIRDLLVMGPWALAEAPGEIRFDDQDFARLPKQYEVTVILVKREVLPATDLETWVRYGAKSFRTLTESEDADFPVKFVDPEAFEKEGHSGDALWVVRCNNEDFELRPEECFEVWLNKKVDGRLQRAIESGTAGKLLLKDMFVEMQFEIARRVFEDGERPVNNDGLCARLTKRLVVGSDLEFDDLKVMAKKNPDRLRSVVQSAFRLTSQFESSDVRRRRS